jgi:hypothetical protein
MQIKYGWFNNREQYDKYLSSFSHLCTTLAGFSGAFVVFILSFDTHSVFKRLSLIFFMVACFGYVVAATWFTNSLYQKEESSKSSSSIALNIFLVCNLLVWIRFISLLINAKFTSKYSFL